MIDEARAAAQAHVPVMLDRIVDVLKPALTDRAHRPVLVDATLGMGGHSEALLAAAPEATLVGLDRDPAAIARATARLAEYRDRIHIVHTIYDSIAEVLDELSPDGADAILFDLGVSSLQLDEADRGFAYAQDAPLDMRMDPTTGVNAEEMVNEYEPGELVRIIAQYGEERFARRVVKAIVREREKAPITSTARLAELVRDAIPAATRTTGGHPAKRTFQALRIAVNSELDVLSRAIPAALSRLRVGGRIAVLSYHSLEDRIVKQAFVAGATSTAPADLPIELPGHEPVLRLITRGAEKPSATEIATNKRATSARLRVAERIREAA
ncbi:MAG: 16S rRNA (cytosine(1402)-N(4))-methyltransferase RsmH [Corynebacteriales bacterium]|nr:16S rRNA (cytosine(1402)-N(4))-methyltransferase RsmH [Mycobacteriales bacterium]